MKKYSIIKYVVIIEKGANTYGAYVPDLPGCVAVGESENEVKALIREAIEFHIEGIKSEKKRIPKVKSKIFELEIGV